MSTFVLVHGAWQSTGTWDLLAPLLQERGHRVITPILRGLGSDQGRLTSELALHHHVEDVGTQLANLADKVVLVGHSYAGIVISGAVESHPAKVQRLVFLDAFLPEDASAFSDVTPGWVHEAEGRRGRRVRKSRQKEAAGAADAGVMQIEWIERGV